MSYAPMLWLEEAEYRDYPSSILNKRIQLPPIQEIKKNLSTRILPSNESTKRKRRTRLVAFQISMLFSLPNLHSSSHPFTFHHHSSSLFCFCFALQLTHDPASFFLSIFPPYVSTRFHTWIGFYRFKM
ncbi:hypothetical protein VNO77_18411 [Canavalia gladiata]|uniref:Uncharacterized protein n=1 Tax=Canavalia gladiata TaxID=3824 RepID=A0AAN9LP82_CANGL